MSLVCRGMMWSGMLAFVLALGGCAGDEGEDGADGADGGATSSSTGGDEEGHEEHSHGDSPHGGTLIEFGGDYHGEFVHDEESVTVYILDADASEQVAIAAELITLNVTQDGEETQYELQPEPDTGDATGRSSRFTLTDAELIEAIEAEGTTMRAQVVIDDVSYNADISHDHGHSHD